MKKFSFLLALAAITALPGVAFAQKFSNVTQLFEFFTNLIYNSLVPLLLALALIYFLWGVVIFIRNADNQAEREKGRGRMLWGVIALFVIVSVWGLVGVLANTFGIPVCLPGAPGTGCRSSAPPPPSGPQPNFDFQLNR